MIEKFIFSPVYNFLFILVCGLVLVGCTVILIHETIDIVVYLKREWATSFEAKETKE